MTDPLAPRPETNVDHPEVHKHQIPIVNIEEKDNIEDKDRETLEYEPPETAEAVLLELDEADALFGKRGEVKDSHDRY
jgi:hypothetical protein